MGCLFGIQTLISILPQSRQLYMQYHCYIGRVITALDCTSLTHWGRQTHICVIKLTIIGSDNGLSPSHYLNQCWNIVNWTLSNKLQWNFNRNSNIFFKKMCLKVSSVKWWPFCIVLNVLKHFSKNTVIHQPSPTSFPPKPWRLATGSPAARSCGVSVYMYFPGIYFVSEVLRAAHAMFNYLGSTY